MNTQQSPAGQPESHAPLDEDAQVQRPILHLPTQRPASPGETAQPESDASQPGGIDSSGDANFASREIGGATAAESEPAGRKKPVGGTATTISKQRAPAGSIVNADQQAAIDRCKAVRIKSGPIAKTTWSPKSVEMLSASLEFVTAFGGDEKALDAVRLMLKAEGHRNRALNKGNIELIGLHLCLLPKDKPQRKEWSRFASVVRLAVHHKTSPTEAEAWLKQRTLSAAVAEARALSKPERTTSKRIAAPISKGNRPNIWKALTSDDIALREQTNNALDDLEKVLRTNFGGDHADA